MALHDVDEFLQPRFNSTVAAWLAALEPSLPAELGALQVSSWWFGRLAPARAQQRQRPRHRRRLHEHAQASPRRGAAVFEPCSLVTATFNGAAPGPVLGEREKLLARPDNVAYVSVHQVTTPIGAMQAVDPEQLRVAHFKMPLEREPYPVADHSMQRYAASVAAQMAPWCGRDQLQQVMRGAAAAESGGDVEAAAGVQLAREQSPRRN